MSHDDQPTGSFDRSGHGLPVEQALLLEEACDAFEATWRGGGRPDIAAAVVELPEAGRPAGGGGWGALGNYYPPPRGGKPGPGRPPQCVAGPGPPRAGRETGCATPTRR